MYLSGGGLEFDSQHLSTKSLDVTEVTECLLGKKVV